ncbi:hypothetical protein ACFE04_031990 [Oxalis oulophora]
MAPINVNAKLRVAKAFSAMKVLGITEDKVKPVLKKLLRLYDKNWEPIEEENYRVLVDTIFEEEEETATVSKPNQYEHADNYPKQLKNKRKQKNKQCQMNPCSYKCGVSDVTFSKFDQQGKNLEEESVEHEELEEPLKRRKRTQGPVGSSLSHTDFNSDGPLLKRSKVDGEHAVTSSSQRSLQVAVVNKGKKLVSTQLSSIERIHSSQRASQVLRIKDHNEQGVVVASKQKATNSLAMIIPKDEPVTDDIVPVAVVHPGTGSSIGRTTKGKQAGPACQKSLVLQNIETESRDDCNTTPKSPPSLDIASSILGEVKISFICNSDITPPNFHMPSLDELRKAMEEKCLRSYKVFDPSLSFTKLMQDMCQSFLEVATDSSPRHAPGDGGKLTKACIRSCASNRPAQIPVMPSQRDNILDNDGLVIKEIIVNGHVESSDKKESKDPEFISSDCNLDEVKSIHDVNDITKGEETLEVSWVNEITDEWLPFFHYLPQNIVFKNASVKFLLSRIEDTNCCTCINDHDCLSSTGSCACAYENTGEFAYTSEGLLKEEILNERISMTLKIRNYQFCNECPLASIKKSETGDVLEACKGHLKRKVIKECWKKCGCFKRCGNRVVQRGITHKLQVFYTPDGKGWGLRTLEKIPKGAFVCEFVGEILTIKELFERKMGNTDSEKYSCPFLLDAFWSSKGVPKDEEALCLETTCYGNVARFINHRCFDANLIEIPVEIETPDHHYYHIAFFTTREIDALEELTWDYGVQFDKRDNLVKTFRCQCGSEFCRNIKRLNKGCYVASGPSHFGFVGLWARIDF